MTKSKIETTLEAFLFNARWLLAPFYIGLVIALVVVLVAFGIELWAEVDHLLHTPVKKIAEGVIVMSLSLIDLSLAANLLLIVIFSGYENFVSRIETGPDEDRPHWMGTVDFSGLKMKLIASIVAISAIALLRTFLVIGDQPMDQPVLFWQLAFHLTFVVSGVMLALMDFIASKTEKHGAYDA